MKFEFKIKLDPTADHLPGYAVFRLPKKWKESTNQVQISLSRNEQTHLQLSEKDGAYIWGSSQDKHNLTDFTEQDGRFQTVLGPAIVNALLRSNNFNYFITLYDPTSGASLLGQLIIDPNSILDSSSINPNAKEEVSEPEPIPEPEPILEPEPELVIEPEPEPEPITEPASEPTPVTPPSTPASAKEKTSSPIKILVLSLLAALLLLALIAGGLYWWIVKKDHHSNVDALGRPVASDTAHPACDVSQLGNRNDVQFSQDCLAENPSSAQLLETIEQAKKSKQCAIAQRLYAHKAQGGDVTIASAYVKEYDPKYHKDSDCFAKPDVDTAIYWYEVILNNDPNNKEAKARLDALQQN